MPQSESKPSRSFLDALRGGSLVFDGAMGTQLYERGVLYSACFEELSVSRPELVAKIHGDYVRAGAHVVETNTFGANALRLEKHGASSRVREFNLASAHVARGAAGSKAFVAGAMGPSGYFLGEASDEDIALVRRALLEQAMALVEGGVDVLLVETIRQTRELDIAIEAAHEASGGLVPIIVSVSLDEKGRMADGIPTEDLARRLTEQGVHGIGVNCSDGPMHVLSAVERMLISGLPVIAMPNAGLPRRVDERLVYISTPEYFGLYARRLYKLGVAGVGGCCGTTPEHIRRIAAAARMSGAASLGEDTAPMQRAPFESDAGEEGTIPPSSGYRITGSLPPVPFPHKSKFASKIGKRLVVSVEVNPPIGLDPRKAIDAAKMLKAGGIDVVNIADGARAQMRMSNLALAVRIQQEVDIETILHVCGRDRNLLGSIAHMIGAHELGIRNVVMVTGDPPKMGDFPDATPVYDLDSIGLLKLAARLNHGIDPSGKPLGAATQFLLATGAEPAALNYARELTRLRLKKEAGAELIMTQPVYDPAVLRRFLEDVKPLGLPVLVGLLPLASFRNAEFLHNEVPGMQVPEDIRERMRAAGTGAPARKEGVAIAREMLSAVHADVEGVYIMPPLERYELALEVMDGFLGK